jgi:outer membrane protein insertion porin family
LAVALPLAGHLPPLGATAAEAAVVSRIVVKGNQRVEASTITNYITIKAGKPFGPADVDESVKRLYSTNLFSDVNIAQGGNALVIAVVENPIIGRVLFTGNKKIKSDILVSLVDTKPRGVLTDARLQIDVQRIENYYESQGRGGATVETKIDQLPNNRVDVTFVISEGVRTGVYGISFVGNHAFSSSRLKSVVQTRTHNWLSWLNKRDVFSEAKLDADKEALTKFYTEHGYADFRVISADHTFDEASGKYFVTFTVEEGDYYTFGDISIDSSIQGVDGASLMPIVRTKSGKMFNSLLLQKSVEDLTVELSRNGYAFAQVRPRGDRDYQNHRISVTYVVDEGARVYVEQINIRGNTKTRDYVIRREFEIAEGDAYNRVLIDKAERRLKSLGYFKTVAITTEQGSSPDRVIVNVNVEDKSTGSFSVGAGVSTDNGFVAEVSMQESNFLGRGQQVNASVGRGDKENTYSASFTDPYFLGSHVTFGLDGYKREVSSSSYRPYDSSAIGGGVRFGLPITDDLTLQLNYKIVQNTISDSKQPSLPNGDELYPDGDRLTSSVGYAVVYNSIDNAQDARQGIFVKLAQDFAGVGGDAQYVKTTLDASYYQPLSTQYDIVGLLRFGAGNIVGIGQDVAIRDNFFKGGETIRGFANLGYGPRAIWNDGKDHNVALGGTTYVNGTAEVQFPMPFFPSDFGLRAAVFGDAGTLFGVDSNDSSILDSGSIRASVGASLLWASPFGLLRADLAQAVLKESYDETQIFRFGASKQF